jgi:tRNA modification GTPase
VFRPCGNRNFPLPQTAFFGTLIDPATDLIVDQVIVSTFVAPASYTGEDLAEISPHGNPVILSGVMTLLLNQGVRCAEAGEFTRRAFLNGKLDLLDVEALGHVLTAPSQRQAAIALNQLEGAAARRLSALRERLLEHLTLLEAGINFPEEAIDDIDEDGLAKDLGEIHRELSRFLVAARHGGLLSQGLAVALIGRPNTGKSSLLNALLGRERAIVTPIPGTTRDTLEESCAVEEFPVRFIDTAGLHRPGDEIEEIGIMRTRQAVAQAYALLGVFDVSQPLDEDDQGVIHLLKDAGKPVLAVLNKCDLPAVADPDAFVGIPTVRISAATSQGIDTLLGFLAGEIRKNGLDDLHDLVLLGAQQVSALQKAMDAVERTRDGCGRLFHDLLSVELHDSVRFLGMITGETIDINTLDRIFERFCIGK